MIKAYYRLAKPGIIYGNIITTVAGFLLASRHFDLWLFASTLVGISFVMGSACVFNNFFDQDIDQRMDRTKNRALVTHTISGRNALIYGIVLGVIGFAVLLLHTNPLTTLIAGVGFIIYVGVYTPLKRRSIHATLVGAISGAVPPIVGYSAVTNRFDSGAILLFLILTFWQMPHFYSIAIYRLNDYTAALIPVLPVKKGVYITKIAILVYIIGFIITAGLLTVFGFTGYWYLGIVALIGFTWLSMALGGFRKNIDETLWAKKMFRFSLIVLLIISITISISGIINK